MELELLCLLTWNQTFSTNANYLNVYLMYEVGSITAFIVCIYGIYAQSYSACLVLSLDERQPYRDHQSKQV